MGQAGGRHAACRRPVIPAHRAELPGLTRPALCPAAPAFLPLLFPAPSPRSPRRHALCRYSLPWDMTTAGHRQFNPLFVLRRGAAFLQEAVATLQRRWAAADVLPPSHGGQPAIAHHGRTQASRSVTNQPCVVTAAG